MQEFLAKQHHGQPKAGEKLQTFHRHRDPVEGPTGLDPVAQKPAVLTLESPVCAVGADGHQTAQGIEVESTQGAVVGAHP